MGQKGKQAQVPPSYWPVTIAIDHFLDMLLILDISSRESYNHAYGMFDKEHTLKLIKKVKIHVEHMEVMNGNSNN